MAAEVEEEITLPGVAEERLPTERGSSFVTGPDVRGSTRKDQAEDNSDSEDEEV